MKFWLLFKVKDLFLFFTLSVILLEKPLINVKGYYIVKLKAFFIILGVFLSVFCVVSILDVLFFS